jgi:microcystin-dependent protein
MPTDNNGNYSLPSGYLAVDGTTIQASQHNPPLEDIASALSGRISRNGSAPMTAPLKHADGVVGAPAITFGSAPTTGLYKTANGIGVAVGGAKVAEFVGGGVLGARVIGELVPFTGGTPPPLFVFPFGQNLSRAAYPDLWAFAQGEIAAGSLFYNNGDGVSTFGIADMRGRVPANRDTAAGRLTTAGGGVDGATLGSVGGNQSHTLTLAQLPTGIASSGNNAISVSSANPVVKNANLGINPGAASGTAVWFGGQASIEASSNPSQAINVTSNNTGGAAHFNTQPTIVTNYMLFAGA